MPGVERAERPQRCPKGQVLRSAVRQAAGAAPEGQPRSVGSPLGRGGGVGSGAGGAGNGARPNSARSEARVSRRASTSFSHAVRSGSCSISESTHAPARSFRRLSAVRFAAASAVRSRASSFARNAIACSSCSFSALIFSSCLFAIDFGPASGFSCLHSSRFRCSRLRAFVCYARCKRPRRAHLK